MRLDLGGQPFTGLPPCVRQIGCHTANAVPQLLFLGTQFLDALFAVGDAFKFSLSPLAKGQDLLDGIAVFAFETIDQTEAFFHLGQPRRAEFDAFTIVVKGAGQFIHLDGKRLGQPFLLTQAGINLAQLVQRAYCLAQ